MLIPNLVANCLFDLAVTPWRLVDSNTANRDPGPWQSGAPPLEPYINPALATSQSVPAETSHEAHFPAAMIGGGGQRRDATGKLFTPARPLLSNLLPQNAPQSASRRDGMLTHIAWTERGRRDGLRGSTMEL